GRRGMAGYEVGGDGGFDQPEDSLDARTLGAGKSVGDQGVLAADGVLVPAESAHLPPDRLDTVLPAPARRGRAAVGEHALGACPGVLREFGQPACELRRRPDRGLANVDLP